ncbi:MAG TPA: GDP-mannose 4,6-dehydratase [Candidatus Binatus sp.]|nr:GDP-mannose 4,6-dehydratase [Candidatus Binatus sp.]
MDSITTEGSWLVSGAAGFLGSHVVDELLVRGAHVVGVDNLAWGNTDHLKPFLDNRRFTFAKLDIREASAAAEIIKKFSPGHVIHLAALHYIPAAMADPATTVSINVHGTQVMLSAARAAGIERFFFASTGDVYRPAEQPHRECDSLEPFNIYGLSKLLGERLVDLASKEQPTAHFVIGRLFNLYGSRETNAHFIPETIKQLRGNSRVSLKLGNLSPRRDLVPVGDAARAIIEMLERSAPGLNVMNVASGRDWSMREVIDLLAELLGKQIDVTTDPARVRAVERPFLRADVSRLKAALDWTPHADLRRGLGDLLKAEGLMNA